MRALRNIMGREKLVTRETVEGAAVAMLRSNIRSKHEPGVSIVVHAIPHSQSILLHTLVTCSALLHHTAATVAVAVLQSDRILFTALRVPSNTHAFITNMHMHGYYNQRYSPVILLVLLL